MRQPELVLRPLFGYHFRLVFPGTAPELQGANRLFELYYHDLRRIAGRKLRDRPLDSLRPTELVNETWMRFSRESGHWQKTHFLNMAALQMRRILIDHARKRNAAVRGGRALTVCLDDARLSVQPDIDFLILDQALTAFAAVDPRACEVFVLRAFTGCTMQEAADSVGISLSAAERDWRAAKAWLQVQLARPR